MQVALSRSAKRMLRYLEDSEDLKLGVTELQEQLGISEIFRQGEEDVCIASLARWNAHLKGLVESEKRCQHMMTEDKL